MKRTPLYDIHISLGAKVAPFGGFDMPIQYTGILEEHAACRNGAALFDICHMGEFTFEGPTAKEDLENLLTCSIETLEIGQCRYGFLCNNEGGVIDDQIVYHLDNEYYMMVVNSSTYEKDLEWIQSNISTTTLFTNISEETAKIDIQGPKAPQILNTLLSGSIETLGYFRASHDMLKDVEVLVSRTGYTGEVGFELYFDAKEAVKVWEILTDAGAIPAGLGARDTLRLEMGLPLYGHELNETTNPLSTGYDRSIELSKQFIGKNAMMDASVNRVLCGICFEGRQKPRDGEDVSDGAGKVIGTITSGGFSPSLQKGIALAYLDKDIALADTLISVIRKRKSLEGTVVSLPFYTEATARKKMSIFL